MKTVPIIILFSLQIFSQSNSLYTFSVNGEFGLTFPGTTAWNFSKDQSRNPSEYLYSVNPGYYFGLGIESKKLLSVENIGLYFGLEVSYGKSSTGEVELHYYGSAEFEIGSLPIMFWTTIKPEGKIVPFFKFGIGAAQSEFEEIYKLKPQYNFNIKDWFFAWGIGGGIDFNFINRVKMSLFVDAVIMETGIQEVLPDGRTIYFDSRNGSTYSGLQIGYYF